MFVADIPFDMFMQTGLFIQTNYISACVSIFMRTLKCIKMQLKKLLDPF